MKRKALKSLDRNVAASRKVLPILPVNTNDPAAWTRKSASTSKTPKISNRGTIPSTGKPPTKPGSSDTSKQFVTTRNRRRGASKNRVVARSLRLSSAKIEVHPSNHSDDTSPLPIKKASRSSNFQTTVEANANANASKPKSPAEDMDLCSESDSELDLSTSTPENSPLPNEVWHFSPTPSGDSRSRGQNESPGSVSSIHALSPRVQQGHTGHRQDGTRPHVKRLLHPVQDTFQPCVTDEYMQGIQEAPADDPSVLKKLLGGAPLLGTEIGVNLELDSMDGSEITASTLAETARRAPPNAMPFFAPWQPESPPKIRRAAKANTIEEVKHHNGYESEIVEEWSLPDEETNETIEIIVDEKKYIHNALPPGWEVKVSRSRKRPFYVHPDHGVTWHCPVVLKPKSKARIFRKSEDGTESRQQASIDKIKIRKQAHYYMSPLRNRHSFDGTMSDLIKFCDKAKEGTQKSVPRDGYEGSASSCCSIESKDTHSTTQASSHANSTETWITPMVPMLGHQAKQDQNKVTVEWATPLRSDTLTPKNFPLRASVKKSSSTSKLSPIAEHDYLPGRGPKSAVQAVNKANQDIPPSETEESGAQSEPERISVYQNSKNYLSKERNSTPRVSFEPLEIAQESLVMASRTNPRSPVLRQLSPSHDSCCNTGTRVTDIEEGVECNNYNVMIEIGSVSHSAYRKKQHATIMDLSQNGTITPALTLKPQHKARVAPAKRTNRHSSVDVSNVKCEIDVASGISMKGAKLSQTSEPYARPVSHQVVKSLNHSSSRNRVGKLSYLSSPHQEAYPKAHSECGDLDGKARGKADVINALPRSEEPFDDEWSPLRENSETLHAETNGSDIDSSFSEPYASEPDGDCANTAFSEMKSKNPTISPKRKQRNMIHDKMHTNDIDSSIKMKVRSFRPPLPVVNHHQVSPTELEGALFSVVAEDLTSANDSFGEDHSTSPAFFNGAHTYEDISVTECSLSSDASELPNSEWLVVPSSSRNQQCLHKFGWFVLHPPHPLCSLQRLDMILKKHREKKKITPKKRSTREKTPSREKSGRKRNGKLKR